MSPSGKQWLDRGRVMLHGVVYAETGNRVAPLRWARQAVQMTNDLLGQPLCSELELKRRNDGVAATREAVAAERQGAAQAKREAAPVVLYVTDQDFRTRRKIEEIFKGREIPFQTNDVTEDEASRSWALTQAKKAEFPLVFIAGEPIGGLDEVMQLDVRGELSKKVFG